MDFQSLFGALDLEGCSKTLREVAKELKEKGDTRWRDVARSAGVIKTIIGVSEVASGFGSMFKK